MVYLDSVTRLKDPSCRWLGLKPTQTQLVSLFSASVCDLDSVLGDALGRLPHAYRFFHRAFFAVFGSMDRNTTVKVGLQHFADRLRADMTSDDRSVLALLPTCKVVVQVKDVDSARLVDQHGDQHSGIIDKFRHRGSRTPRWEECKRVSKALLASSGIFVPTNIGGPRGRTIKDYCDELDKGIEEACGRDRALASLEAAGHPEQPS
jgi:hypothetical protein